MVTALLAFVALVGVLTALFLFLKAGGLDYERSRLLDKVEVLENVARRLEAERDEARNERDRLHEQVHSLRGQRDAAADACDKLRAMRARWEQVVKYMSTEPKGE
jgi:uncharacterized coiled-coil DUF342 family protein